MTIVFLATLALAANDSPIDFDRDVRPILSDHCFQCHGPDENQRQAGLRLDQAEAALAVLESGNTAVVPNAPEKSELVRRVTSLTDDERMPPRESGKSLSKHEQGLLLSWIRQGAVFSEHWSYQTPARKQVPNDPRHPLSSTPIDAFVGKRRHQQRLHPSVSADRHAFIRRLSIDLTGLPPSWDEVEHFVNDTSPLAVQRLIDRMICRPTVGEHWARLWLDLARYADSAGYADDPPRTIWAYRDWVIRALNANMPFDQFTVEQLAGDLLSHPRESQLVATAFHRNTLTNNEGGTNDEEFRNVAIVDRVNTTMAVWMGTTMACAQCHHHKYDPISQEDYFRLFAIFNNSADSDKRDEQPTLEIWNPDKKKRQADLQQTVRRLDTSIAALKPKVLEQQGTWESRFRPEPIWTVKSPARMHSAQEAVMTLLDDGSVLISRPAGTDIYTLEFLATSDTTLTAIQLESLTDLSLPNQGPGYADGNFVVSQIRAHVVPPAEAAVRESTKVLFRSAFADHSAPGFGPEHVIPSTDDSPVSTQTGWSIGEERSKPHHLTLIPVSPIRLAAKSTLVIEIHQQYEEPHYTLGRVRLRETDHAHVEEFAAIPASLRPVLQLSAEGRSEQQQEELAEHYLSVAPDTKAMVTQRNTLHEQIAALQPETTVPIMRELSQDQRRTTHIQHRGNFLILGDKVTAGLPAVFHDHESSENEISRLNLARWLVSDQNPLTARVIVNRYWETLFGVGLVSTSEDFGAQGALPSHPDLLDWLATELIRAEWDTRRLLRQIVSSSTYGQSSEVTPAAYEQDPDNRWLARGPRFRISAETVRDQALFVSGLLDQTLYGPPVRPPQPQSNLRAAFGPTIDWATSDGSDRYRRAMYTVWRRSNPYPSMATFDAPDRQVCTVRRSRTNTPLQALVTMNDPVYVEAAQSLARRIYTEADTDAGRIRQGVRHCLSRDPSETEIDSLLTLYQQAYERLAETPDSALQLATVPLGDLDEGEDAIVMAAWTVVGNVLLNLDEVFLKR